MHLCLWARDGFPADGKVIFAGRHHHIRCMWSGSSTQARCKNGYIRYPAYRLAQQVNLRHQQVPFPLQQGDGEEIRPARLYALWVQSSADNLAPFTSYISPYHALRKAMPNNHQNQRASRQKTTNRFRRNQSSSIFGGTPIGFRLTALHFIRRTVVGAERQSAMPNNAQPSTMQPNPKPMPRNVRGKANVMDSVYGGLPRGESALHQHLLIRLTG